MTILISIAVGFVALTTISDLLGVWFVIKNFYSAYFIRILEHFAVGTLLALAFLDLLPEAMEGQSIDNIFLTVLFGIVVLYFLERILNWQHHTHDVDCPTHPSDKHVNSAIVFAGATLEEFVDGIAIGLSVVLSNGSLLLPLTTSIAIFAHELPDSISRAVAFIRSGTLPSQALKKVLWTTLGSFVGAILAVSFSSLFISLQPFLAALAAAAFIYIAALHIIPDLHHLKVKHSLTIEILAMILGVILIKLIGLLE